MAVKTEGVRCFVSRLHHHVDYDDARPVTQAKPVTGDTNEEMGQRS